MIVINIPRVDRTSADDAVIIIKPTGEMDAMTPNQRNQTLKTKAQILFHYLQNAIPAVIFEELARLFREEKL
jgi:hypothetical protein